MAETRNLFAHSAAYDGSMGRLSRLAGAQFLDWLALPPGLQWLDVGCGTGSFTELVLDRNKAGPIIDIDPSADQIAFAKTKPGADRVDYRQGDAQSLSLGDGQFDVATPALVIQYIPDRDKAMAEIIRVLRPGGTIAAYVWPAPGDGHPMQPLTDAVKSIGISQSRRPGNQIRTIGALTDLFQASGLEEVESRVLEIRLSYKDFDDYWSAQTGNTIRNMSEADMGRLKAALRERLPAGENGGISYTARANAIRVRVAA